MMSWTEFINQLLATTHKIQKVAVLSEDGQPVAVTDDLQVSVEEGHAIARCIVDPARTVTKVHIDNNFYTVFQGNDKTVIGTSPSREWIFVAHKEKDAIVVVFGKTKGHGSFLFELKKNLLAKEHYRAHGQRQVPVGGQGQIQQIMHAAEIERRAVQEADDIELPDDTEQAPETFPQIQETVEDDMVLIQMQE